MVDSYEPMPNVIKLRKEINLPIFVIIIGIVIGVYHWFSYLFPFTNNAFVATNITPVAADVSGYVTKVYVKNGEAVKKGAPLIRVYQKPYQLALDYAKSKYEQAIERIAVIEHQTKRTRALLNAANYDYEKAKLRFNYKDNKAVRQAIPMLEIKELNYSLHAAEKKRDALQHQIEIEDQQIVEQKKKVSALKAAMDNAQVNFNLTILKAPADGYVDNMYISNFTPVKIHEPLFSFVDSSQWWVQANFDETDLRRIRPGDKAYIILRMYYFHKFFHGEIVYTIWPANRQTTSSRSQQQIVKNENEWLLIPQRLPLQIKILDPDPNFPLQPGASAYVYLKAHTHD